MSRLLLIVFYFPLILYSQNNRYYFLEGGTAINAPFSQNFHVQDDRTSTTSYEWKGSIKSLPSYYVRGGIEKQFSLCHMSQISFPISISYFNAIETIEMDGGWAGCMGGFYGHQSIMRNNHAGLIMIGIKQLLNFSPKISLQNSLNLSNNLLFCSTEKVKQTGEAERYNYVNTEWIRTIHASLSLQTGLFFKLSEKSKIGLTAEYFFMSKRLMPKNDTGYGTFGFGITPKNTLLTAGIRLQHSF